MFYLLLVASAILMCIYLLRYRRPANFPPGPLCLPVFGSSPFTHGTHAHFKMEKWRDQYGPVVGIMMGSKPALAVVEAHTVMEVLRHEDFQGRPKPSVIDDIRRMMNSSGREFLGIFFSDGPYWVEQRRFTHRNLKDFGFGKKSMEGLILEEAEVIVKELCRSSPKIVQVSLLFAVSVTNVLWSVMAGDRHQRDDADFQNLLKKLDKQVRGGQHLSLLNVFPWLKAIIPNHRQQKQNQADIHQFIRRVIREHEKTFDADNMRDFIDVYLKEMHLGKSDSGFHEESLIAVCLDLFAAGAQTVGNTLGFCLIYLIRHPEIQTRIQEELDKVVGSRRVSLDDRPNLVYLEAFLVEVLRINPNAPLTVPHRVTRDILFKGYSIPKDTLVSISLWSICHDVTHWGDPQNFRPERHIDADGKLIKDEFSAAFGFGKRGCPGEMMARNTLFLFFATLMQELEFTLPQGHELPSTMSLPGFTVSPRPLEVLVKMRVR